MMTTVRSRALRASLGAVVSALALAVAAPAFAHASHGEPMYGGVVAEAGMFQGELVARARQLVVYITNHGEPVPTAGAQAKATLLAGGQKTELALAPAGENQLTATASAPLPAGARAVVAVKLGDGRAGSLRFELK